MRSLIFIILIGCQLLSASYASAVPSGKSIASAHTCAVVVLPFAPASTARNQATNYSYLATGVRDILISRLAAMGVGPICTDTHQPTNQLTNQQTNQQTNQPTKISGHYQPVNNGIELTAAAYTTAQQPPKLFSVQAAAAAEVIKAVERLAAEIGRGVFGKTLPLAVQETHAEKLRSPVLPLPAGYSHNGHQSLTAKRQPLFTESQAINLHLVSLGVGDLDGDGSNDLVLAGRHKVLVFKIQNGNLKKMAEFTGPLRADIVYISMADINNDGRQEIYVSAITADKPASFALRWRQTSLDYLVNDVPYYLRAMRMIDGKWLLIGEEDNGQLAPIFYVMRRKGDRLHAARRLEITAPVTIFNFSLADLDDDRQAEVISRPAAGHLRIMSSRGRVLWAGESGSDSLPLTDDLAVNDDKPARLDMGGRIIVRDINGTNEPEFISDEGVGTQDELAMHKKIHLLKWTGWAPKELWHTAAIDDLVDYQIGRADAKKSGQTAGYDWMLYVGVNLSRGILDIMSPDQCRILMYPVRYNGMKH